MSVLLFFMITMGGISGGIRLVKGPIKPVSIPIGDYSFTTKVVDFKINQIIRRYDVPGAAVSLLDEQEIIMEKYYGWANEDAKISFSNTTVLKIGSITKLFTAIEIMHLVEDGLIDLDHPLTDYLPEFYIKSHFNSTPITIRHILSHRAGLPRNDNLELWHWDNGTDCLKDQMKSLAESTLSYPAGTRYKYSNIGYDLLAHVIESLRNQSFVYYMEENFFHKWNMRGTHYFSSDFIDPSLISVGYYQNGHETVPYHDMDINSLGSGAMLSQMGDLQKFFQILVKDAGSEEERILSFDTINAMYDLQYCSDRDPQETGLGFQINTHKLAKKVVFHTGVNLGRHSCFAYIPETKQGVILFGNHDNFEEPAKNLIFEILELMLETKTGISPQKIVSKDEIYISQAELEQYVGTYIIDGQIATIKTSNRGLKINYLDQNMRMIPINSTTFKLKHWFLGEMGYEVRFISGSSFSGESDLIMILSLEKSHYIFCPRIYPLENFDLSGNYTLFHRVCSLYTESKEFGNTKIEKRDGFCFIPLLKAVLVPFSSKEVLIIGGLWDGETIFIQDQGEHLEFQNMIFFRQK
ncbi:serine hydrolase domain-containing protein [Candidatus Lokiarchaeum ossiferum]